MYYLIELSYYNEAGSAMPSPLTNTATVGANLVSLRRGLGQNGTPIPAYRTLGVDVRTAAAGSPVVRVPTSWTTRTNCWPWPHCAS